MLSENVKWDCKISKDKSDVLCKVKDSFPRTAVSLLFDGSVSVFDSKLKCKLKKNPRRMDCETLPSIR